MADLVLLCQSVTRHGPWAALFIGSILAEEAMVGLGLSAALGRQGGLCLQTA